VVVQVISQKIVTEHQKQVVKVASTAAGTLKMTRNAPPKPGKKGVKTVMAAAVASATHDRY